LGILISPSPCIWYVVKVGKTVRIDGVVCPSSLSQYTMSRIRRQLFLTRLRLLPCFRFILGLAIICVTLATCLAPSIFPESTGAVEPSRSVPLSASTSAMIQSAPVPGNPQVSLYPSCPNIPEHSSAEDLEYFLYKLDNAIFNAKPFPHMFFCDMFRPSFYADMAEYFPPYEVMPPTKSIKVRIVNVNSEKA